MPNIVTSITISPNGNSPEIKMVGGMMVDVQQGFVPMISTARPEEATTKSNYDKSRKASDNNSTKLSINERYRRLIPYMTFYYANDLAPTTEAYYTKNVEVEKAEILEGKNIEQHNQRQPKKIVYSQRNIPRYQGNRLTHFNIASANPTKVFYKEGVPTYQSARLTPNYNPILSEQNNLAHDYDQGRFVQKHIVKSPSAPFTPSTRQPYLNLYSHEDAGNVQYYVSGKDQAPKYKLVPYEQTPPVKVTHNEHFEPKKLLPVPVLVTKDQVYIKPRPVRPQYVYDNGNVQQLIPRKQPVVVSENYYEKRRPVPALVQPVIESGFKPIITHTVTTEGPLYTNKLPATPYPYLEKKPEEQIIETAPVAPEVADYRPNYYQYVEERPAYTPAQQEPSQTVSLADLLNSLQLNKSIPKPITRENVGSSIRTLLQVLNALKAMSHENEVETPILSTPTPFVASEVMDEVTAKPLIEDTHASVVDDVDLHEEPYLAPVHTPSQHLDGEK